MEKEQEIKQIIKEIKIYQEKEKLTFFVGAGVSKMSDYPSWSELVLTMASEIGYNVRENGDGWLILEIGCHPNEPLSNEITSFSHNDPTLKAEKACAGFRSLAF